MYTIISCNCPFATRLCHQQYEWFSSPHSTGRLCRRQKKPRKTLDEHRRIHAEELRRPHSEICNRMNVALTWDSRLAPLVFRTCIDFQDKRLRLRVVHLTNLADSRGTLQMLTRACLRTMKGDFHNPSNASQAQWSTLRNQFTYTIVYNCSFLGHLLRPLAPDV